ncbi:MAG TPA: hypothetical protein VK845_16830 [Gemmatimonadales bacterium]|nr:hypothetical protein [Gemmatimonadales bacterium]
MGARVERLGFLAVCWQGDGVEGIERLGECILGGESREGVGEVLSQTLEACPHAVLYTPVEGFLETAS